MNHPLLSIKGRSGRVELYPSRVTIKRKGFFAKMSHGWTKGEKEIFLCDITAIQIKKPGWVEGYIKFILPGTLERRGGVRAAQTDENTVTFFTRKKYETALKIKEQIDKIKMSPAAPISNPQPLHALDELKKWKELLDMKAISIEEYNEIKQKYLRLR